MEVGTGKKMREHTHVKLTALNIGQFHFHRLRKNNNIKKKPRFFPLCFSPHWRCVKEKKPLFLPHHLPCLPFLGPEARDDARAQPTNAVACKNGSSVGIRTRCVHGFFCEFGDDFCMLSRCLVTKFLHRSSGESPLRVRCWLGGVHNARGERKDYDDDEEVKNERRERFPSSSEFKFFF